MRRRPEPRGVESGLGRNVSVSPKFYIDAFIFALTGGLIAISYKWCYAAGWDTSAISLGGYRALADGICYLAVALTHRERLLPRGRALWYLGIASKFKMAYNALFVWALVWFDAAFMTIMVACLLPVFGLCLTRIANPVHDRLSIGRVSGCILGGIAAALMGFKDSNDPGSINAKAFLIVSMICLGLALSVVFERKAIEHGTTRMQSMLGATLYSVLGYFIAALLISEKLTAPLGTVAGMWTLLLCILIGVTHLGARRDAMEASQVSGFLLIGLLPRAITVCAALLLLNEVLDWTAILGVVVMPIALWIGRYRPAILHCKQMTRKD